MNVEELGKIIEGAVVEVEGKKKLACAKAFILAQEYQVKLMDIARYCNQNDIRISRCQLGCFK